MKNGLECRLDDHFIINKIFVIITLMQEGNEASAKLTAARSEQTSDYPASN